MKTLHSDTSSTSARRKGLKCSVAFCGYFQLFLYSFKLVVSANSIKMFVNDLSLIRSHYYKSFYFVAPKKRGVIKRVRETRMNQLSDGIDKLSKLAAKMRNVAPKQKTKSMQNNGLSNDATL